jgi:4-methyl-5(b-hydroxyethyl)-thiazole monophosphate biosynthesis
MFKRVILLLADGFEEVEAITPIDYLRRAGIEVTTLAVGKQRVVTGSHGISVQADTDWAKLQSQGKGRADFWDAIVLPGGISGAPNLAASGQATTLIQDMFKQRKLVAAICASPAIVLAPLGLLAGKRFTCYPGSEKDVFASVPGSVERWSAEPVVMDGTLVTSRGAGTAGLFAVAIAGELLSQSASTELARSVLL